MKLICSHINYSMACLRLQVSRGYFFYLNFVKKLSLVHKMMIDARPIGMDEEKQSRIKHLVATRHLKNVNHCCNRSFSELYVRKSFSWHKPVLFERQRVYSSDKGSETTQQLTAALTWSCIGEAAGATSSPVGVARGYFRVLRLMTYNAPTNAR